jgi:hypothetical protein
VGAGGETMHYVVEGLEMASYAVRAIAGGWYVLSYARTYLSVEGYRFLHWYAWERQREIEACVLALGPYLAIAMSLKHLGRRKSKCSTYVYNKSDNDSKLPVFYIVTYRECLIKWHQVRGVPSRKSGRLLYIFFFIRRHLLKPACNDSTAYIRQILTFFT